MHSHADFIFRTEYGEFEFEAHYGKAKLYAQVLHAPRVPYLHGVSMPNEKEGSSDLAAKASLNSCYCFFARDVLGVQQVRW